jgi:DNA-binding beta-propeller fold protein YncE
MRAHNFIIFHIAKHRLRICFARSKYVFIVIAYLLLTNIASLMIPESVSAAFFSDSPTTSYPEVGSSQTIYSSVEASDGSLYVGGLFDVIGGVSRNNLARILADGTVDTTFNPNVNGAVRSLRLDEPSSTLYAGGSFSTVNGSTGRDNIVALDSLTGVARALDVATSGTVYALELNSDASILYVGGSFNDTYEEYTTTMNAVAIDSSNNKYILDATNNKVVKIDTNNNLSAQWGSAGSGDGQFDFPRDIAVDSLDNIYVADENNNRIQKFSSTGTYISQWGSAGTGDGQFSEISSISVDSLNNLYVADPDNNRIQKFSSTGTYISQWGSAGTGDGQFSNLRSVAADQLGNIYTMEGFIGNNRIQKFDSDGLYLTDWGLPLANNYDITTNADGNVYLSTDYSSINSYSPVGVDLGSWEAGDGSLADIALSSRNNDVYAAIVNDNYMQQFSTQSGQEGDLLSTIYASKQRQDLVAFSTSDGSVTNFNASIEACTDGGTVYTLEHDSDTNSLYFGGHISFVQEEVRDGLAKVNAVTGELDEDFNPSITWANGSNGQCSEIYDVALHQGTIYAAGNFDKVNSGTIARNNFAAFETEEGLVDENFNPNVRDTIYAIAYDGSGVVYAGGDFSKVNGNVSRSGLASFRISDGRVTLFNPDIQSSSSVNSLTIANNGSKLFAGGSFDQVGGSQRRGFAVFAQTDCTYVNFFAPAPSEGVSVPLFVQSFGSQKIDGHFLVEYSPGEMAVDADGNVYVIEQEQETGGNVSQILKYSSSGVYITKFGSYGSGNGQFNYPRGVAVDSEGNVYVVDNGNNRVQKFSSSGTYLAQWGSSGFGDGEFDYPSGIAIDGNDNIYIADSYNDRIQKFASDGSYITQWGSSGFGDGEFDFPNALTVDSSGNIIVSDAYNYRIQSFTNVGSYISQFNIGNTANSIDVNSSDTLFVSLYDGLYVYDSAGSLQDTLGETELGNNSVWSVAIDRNDDSIYVGDPTNARVRKLSSSYDYINQWGVPAYQGDSEIYQPRPGNYTVASDGKIYVQSNSGVEPEIKIYAPNGDLLQRWVGSDYYSSGIAVDDDGFVYITYSNSVRKFDDTGGIVGDFTFYQNGGLADPSDIVVDSANNRLYVASTGNNRLFKLSTYGDFLDSEPGLSNMEGLSLSPNAERIYIISSNVKEYNTSNLSLVSQWGETGSAEGEFDSPTGIDTDEVGNIYIADTGNSRIQKYSSDGEYLSQWGEEGTGNGQFAYFDDYPQLGVNVDNQDNVWVADTYNNRLQKFSYIPNSPDYDGDGIPDSEEVEAINDGDGNNDCELDAEQRNVSSLLNNQVGGYITIVGPNGSQFISSNTLTAPNTSDQYPYGLFSFVLDNVSVGAEIEINAYVSSDENPGNLVGRKYFPSTQTYQNIPGATITPLNIGGEDVLRFTYSVTDGSDFDQDGEVNGSISGPAGMAVLGASTTASSPSLVSKLLQNTGNNIFGRLIFSVIIIALVYLLSRKNKKSDVISKDKLRSVIGYLSVHSSKKD